MAPERMPMARLAGIKLFKGLDIDLERFEARANWRRFDPEEVLVDFDEPSTDVYFLLTGEVRVLMRTASGKEVILHEMRPGDLFGELAALDGVPRSANVTALTRGEACVMPAVVFKELLFSHQPVAERLFCLMAARIREPRSADGSRLFRNPATGREVCARDRHLLEQRLRLRRSVCARRLLRTGTERESW